MGFTSALSKIFSNLTGSKFYPGTSMVNWIPGRKYQERDDYVSLVKNGYVRNVHMFRCVDYIYTNFAQIKFGVYKKDKNKNRVAVDNHPINSLFVQPNPNQTWSEFIYAVGADLDLAGNAYMLKVFNAKGEVETLFRLTPWQVEIDTSGKNDPYGVRTYKFGRDQTQLTYNSAEIIHWKAFHPLDEIFGLSRARVGALTVDQNNMGKEWNAQLLQNSGKTDSVFIGEGLGLEKTKEFQKHLNVKFSGKENAGKPLVLGGKWKYQNISMSLKDADWIKSQNMTNGDICTLMGVPSMLIGDNDNKTFKNLSEAESQFWNEREIPLAIAFKSLMNVHLFPKTGVLETKLFVDYDVMHLPAFIVKEEKVIQKLRDADWMTVNEKRAKMNLSPLPGKEYDTIPTMVLVGRINHGDLDADADIDPATDQGDPNEPTGASGNQDKPKATKKPKVVEARNISSERDTTPRGRGKKSHDKEIALQYEIMRRNFEKDYKKRIIRLFALEQNGLESILIDQEDPHLMALAASKYIEENKFKWSEALIKSNAEIGMRFARKTASILKSSKNIQSKDNQETAEAILALALLLDLEGIDLEDLTSNEGGLLAEEIGVAIKQYLALNEIQKNISSIANTSIKRVIETIAALALSGATKSDIIKGVNDVYGDFIKVRSGTIADAETVLSAGLGIISAGKSIGVNNKRWITMGDDAVRNAHQIANNQLRGIDELFDVGGEKLQFPKDSSHGATMANIAGCRCLPVLSN